MIKNVIALIFTSAAIQAADFSPDKDLVYKTVGDVELKLHQFTPEGHQITDKKPAIVFFFGGGWVNGTPKQFYQQSAFFAEKGIVAFSAEYRVKSRNKTTPFDAVEDAKSAVRWIRIYAKELGIDPDRIIASGGSAGGHIAGCTGVIEGLEAANEDLSVSSKPNAMILFNPVLDTTEKGYGIDKVGEKRKTEISITHHIKAGIPPTIVFHGTNDKVVPFENAERFTALMKDAGNECQLYPAEGAGHGYFNASFFRPNTDDSKYFTPTINNTLNFLKEIKMIN